ncbi:MAG: NPCBM/NEW2 domain-containing protein, partial [Clostridia bacterium]|nr:NPCBM/NEW2 domain-containing protein [Clostridia bacterium]
MKRTNKLLALIMSIAMIIGVMSVITPFPVSAAKGVDIYLDELSMSSYIFHSGTGYSWTDSSTGKVYNTPWIGERFEAPGSRPVAGSTTIDSLHTIGGHEPMQGAVAHSDFTWDISAFAANGDVPFSAKVGKAGATTNAEYIVLIDGEQVWTSGNVTAADGLISVTGVTIPQGAQTITLRADRGEDDDWAAGEYHWVDAKLTLPAGSTVTRMETVPFSFSGNENKYWVGEKQGGGAVADFRDVSLNTWRYFTTKNLISGHQNHSSVNGGDAFVSWDISEYGAGYFTVTACNNTAYDLVNQHFFGQFKILVDGVEQTASTVMEVTDGLWKGTVAVPADAQTIKVVINNGGDEHTCGAFTVADPIFVEVPSDEIAPTYLYLDELSMSSYIFHSGTGYSWTDSSTGKVYNTPWIGERFEAPGSRPVAGSTTIDSLHTIGGHEPMQGQVAHSDFTWDISAFTMNGAVPFSAKVGKAGATTNAEYIVLIDGEQVWTSGNVTAADGLISVTGVTIPQGAQTLTLRADRGEDDNWAAGEYHWVDAKLTLPAGSTVTRMETVPFSFLGLGGAADYKIGQHYSSDYGDANFWNVSLNAWNKFTSKKVISGHQTSANDGNAYVKWDVSDFDEGYFTVAVANNWGDTRFDGIFSIIIDGETKVESGLMKGSDGLWRGTVAVPADAQELKVNINMGSDNVTCGAFSVADPIFVECDMPEAPAALPAITASISDSAADDGKIDHLYLNAAISASETRQVGIIFSDSKASCEAGAKPLFIRVAEEGHGKSANGFIQSGCYGSHVITAANLGGDGGDSVIAVYWQDLPTALGTIYARTFAKNSDGT